MKNTGYVQAGLFYLAFHGKIISRMITFFTFKDREQPNRRLIGSPGNCRKINTRRHTESPFAPDENSL
jgi:hypothetical protein